MNQIILQEKRNEREKKQIKPNLQTTVNNNKQANNNSFQTKQNKINYISQINEILLYFVFNFIFSVF